MASIELKGLPDILRILYDLEQIARAGQLGKVWSKGADQGRGRYEHWVQSDQYQVWFHRRTGWRTDAMAVEEFEPVARKLFEKHMGDIEKGRVIDNMRKFAKELMELIYEYMSWYPPEPAGSTYVRTNTLHRSWDLEVSI